MKPLNENVSKILIFALHIVAQQYRYYNKLQYNIDYEYKKHNKVYIKNSINTINKL